MSLLRWAAAVAALALVAGGCGAGASTGSRATSAPRFEGAPTLGSATAMDFSLRDQDGRLVRLSAQRGRIVLVTFLYTRCPDVCPLIAENIAAALRRIGARGRSVRVLAVSVDPAHDTRAAIRRFAAEHRLPPQFRYLSAGRAKLRPIWQGYNLLVEGDGVERLRHSSYVLLLDAAGRPRLYYPSNVSAAALVHDLELMLHRGRPAT